MSDFIKFSFQLHLITYATAARNNGENKNSHEIFTINNLRRKIEKSISCEHLPRESVRR